MALTNTEFGKAYEYACHTALKEHVSAFDVQLVSLPSSIHAQVEPW